MVNDKAHKRKKALWISIVIILVVAIAGGAYWWLSNPNHRTTKVDSDGNPVSTKQDIAIGKMQDAINNQDTSSDSSSGSSEQSVDDAVKSAANSAGDDEAQSDVYRQAAASLLEVDNPTSANKATALTYAKKSYDLHQSVATAQIVVDAATATGDTATVKQYQAIVDTYFKDYTPMGESK